MMLLFLVFFPMAAAVCSYLIGRKDKKLRDHAVQIFCLIEFAVAAAAMGLVVAGKELSAAIPGFCGFGLSFQLDGFRALYALVAGVMLQVSFAQLLAGGFSYGKNGSCAVGLAVGTLCMGVGLYLV